MSKITEDPKRNKSEKNPANENKADENDTPGYEPYPASEDIYNKMKEENVDAEDLLSNPPVKGKTEPNNQTENPYKKAAELDVPGSELDDSNEAAGSEDEENNYYSLGGENHEDLEEDKGE